MFSSCQLSLPKELRLEIWEYVLIDPTKERPILYITRHLEHPKHFGQSPCGNSAEWYHLFRVAPSGVVSVLLVSQLVYAEALPIFII
jgi:hypothetical protein